MTSYKINDENNKNQYQSDFVNMQHTCNYVQMRLIYMYMRLISHVDIIMLHIDINKSHVNIIMLHITCIMSDNGVKKKIYP